MAISFNELQVKLLGGSLPTIAHIGDAAYDLYCKESIVIQPASRAVLPLGIATCFTPNLVAIVKDKSSLALRGLTVLGGVIDSGYRGEWKIIMFNSSTSEPFGFASGDKVAQFILLPKFIPRIYEVNELPDSSRGTGGFGSTGK